MRFRVRNSKWPNWTITTKVFPPPRIIAIRNRIKDKRSRACGKPLIDRPVISIQVLVTNLPRRMPLVDIWRD